MKSNTERSDVDFDYAELRSLIDRNADGMLVVDRVGLVQFANAAALTLFGRAAEHLVGHRLGLPFAAGETTSIDLIRPDGSSLEVEMRVAETMWNGEQALLASLRDISERRLLEEQLRHSQKMEAVGRLTAGVAHDFNNLLTIVLGNLDTVQRRLPDDASDPRLARSIANATTGARRAADLTQQLLAYSRRQPLTPTVVRLDRLLSGMEDLLTRTLGSAITISIDVAPETWPIMVDASQLEAALINLAVNARDAMNSAGTLSIHARNCTDSDVADVAPGEFVCLSVSDTGSGIPAHMTQQVFDPFFTTKGVGKGTGLGLSQVYGFVKQSMGHVQLDSEIGKGTVVRLYLPRHHGAVEQSEDRVARPNHAGTGLTVLLVEDEDDLRDWARGILDELGYEVIAVGSGPAAVEVLESDRPLLLMFTDVSLPGGMDGRQLAEKAAQLRPGMRTLITTAYAGDVLVEGGRLAPGVRLLSKPYTRDQLKKALQAPGRKPAPHVVLVEDDVAVRQTLVECLLELGCTVEELATAAEAMERIRGRQRAISVAIIDVELPDGSGLAVLDALRSAHPEASAIIVSGYLEDNDVRRIEADRRAVMLDKPFSGQELRNVLAGLGFADRAPK